MVHVYTIYALVDEHGERQYIGVTTNVSQRERTHQRNYPHLGFQSLERIVGRQCSFARERELIEDHQPPLNLRHTEKEQPTSNYRRIAYKRAEMDARLAEAAQQYWHERLWS